MSERCAINVDLVDIWQTKERKGHIRTIAWGDHIDVLEKTDDYVKVKTENYVKKKDGSILPKTVTGYLVPTKSSKLKPKDLVIPKAKSKVLKINFVDIQQGDAAVIETPDEQVILVDGGDNQLFARYLAARYKGTSESNPKKIDCIVVTHGDADHFKGLTEIYNSEKNKTARKRLFISPERVYHNGLVKRPSKTNKKRVPDRKLLGETFEQGKNLIITDLETDLTEVDSRKMNSPFKSWKVALNHWKKRGKITFRRLKYGDKKAFDFIQNKNIEISVLGPITTRVNGKEGLKFLHGHSPGPRLGHDSISLNQPHTGSLSASHTINGHSIVFKLSYGKFNYLFTGDLNDEAGKILAKKHKSKRSKVDLKAEVMKVPHHGSADFSGAFFKLVEPVVSVISSGDESSRKEYIHPRATLVGALGKHSRVEEPLIFVTELVAFFNMEGWSRLIDAKESKTRGDFFAFSRTAYGIVKTRTDGNRLLVYTDSGKSNLKEAYCYEFVRGKITPQKVIKG